MQFKLTQFMITAIFASTAMVQAYPSPTVSAREDLSDGPTSLSANDAASVSVVPVYPTTTSELAGKPGASAGVDDDDSDFIDTTPEGYVKFIENPSFRAKNGSTIVNSAGRTGDITAQGASSSGKSCFNLPAEWNDGITFIQVDAGNRCIYYVKSACRGAAISLQDGGSISDFGGGFEKRISSYYCFNFI